MIKAFSCIIAILAVFLFPQWAEAKLVVAKGDATVKQLVRDVCGDGVDFKSVSVHPSGLNADTVIKRYQEIRIDCPTLAPPTGLRIAGDDAVSSGHSVTDAIRDMTRFNTLWLLVIILIVILAILIVVRRSTTPPKEEVKQRGATTNPGSQDAGPISG